MKKIIVLLFVLSLSSVKANPCSCDWSRNFLDLCTESDVVVRFKVTAYDDYQMIGTKMTPLTFTVEIEEVFKGLIPGVEMRFAGNDGTLCRKYVEHFKIGRSYYFQYNYPEPNETPIADICGEYDLLIDNDVVRGNEFQVNSTPVMDVDEFLEALETELGELANPSYRPTSNLNDGTARTYSDALLFTLLGILLLFMTAFVRILYKSRPELAKQ